VRYADDQRHHVLVIGDDAATCDLYRDILEGEGFCVSQAAVPDWELALAGTPRPDLIMLDLQCGENAESTAILGRLTAASPTASIPTLVCSSHHTLLASWYAQLSAKGGGTLCKPFDLQALLTAVWTSVTAREKVKVGDGS
jgi:DNA-binding response OmpR family regulator